mmetsp:Transcript_53316/g.157727  ORF Transcript_53316/g.157727 Transcript_53316/m.157727 type:complete len:594 (+) Transcript_53316:209-1990(+)
MRQHTCGHTCRRILFVGSPFCSAPTSRHEAPLMPSSPPPHQDSAPSCHHLPASWLLPCRSPHDRRARPCAPVCARPRLQFRGFPSSVAPSAAALVELVEIGRGARDDAVARLRLRRRAAAHLLHQLLRALARKLRRDIRLRRSLLRHQLARRQRRRHPLAGGGHLLGRRLLSRLRLRRPVRVIAQPFRAQLEDMARPRAREARRRLERTAIVGAVGAPRGRGGAVRLRLHAGQLVVRRAFDGRRRARGRGRGLRLLLLLREEGRLFRLERAQRLVVNVLLSRLVLGLVLLVVLRMEEGRRRVVDLLAGRDPRRALRLLLLLLLAPLARDIQHVLEVLAVRRILLSALAPPLLALRRQAAHHPCLGRHPLLVKDRPVVEVRERLAARDDGLAVGGHLGDERVALTLQHRQLRHPLEHLDHLGLLKPVVLQVEHGERRHLEQVADVVGGDEVVVGDLERREMAQPAQPLDPRQHVVRDLQRRQLGAALQVLDLADAVLLQVHAAQVCQLVEPLDLVEAVALEPERLQPRPLVQPLDAVVAAVVQVELVVERRRRVELLLLGDLLEHLGRDALVARAHLLVVLHIRVGQVARGAHG